MLSSKATITSKILDKNKMLKKTDTSKIAINIYQKKDINITVIAHNNAILIR